MPITNEKNIHWYPGHMKKATNQIIEKVKLADFAFILLDARAPLSTMNSELLNILKNKPIVFILTKKDLSDEKITDSWIEALSQNGNKALAISQKDRLDKKIIENLVSDLINAKKEKYLRKNIKNVSCRAIVLGIPNVGKSTFINYLKGSNVAKTANKPGLTRSVTWIKINKYFELMDTPGILEAHYENKQIALNLALIGSMKEDILPLEDIANGLLDYLKNEHLEEFNNRYKINVTNLTPNNEILELIAKTRGFLQKGNIFDVDKAIKVVFKEFKNGEICKFSLEKVE